MKGEGCVAGLSRPRAYGRPVRGMWPTSLVLGLMTARIDLSKQFVLGFGGEGGSFLVDSFISVV